MSGARDALLPAGLQQFLGEAASAGRTEDSSTAHGQLVRTLAAAKPGGLILCVEAPELSFWVADGMDITSKLITVVGDELTCARLSRCWESDIRLTAHAQHAIEFLGDVRAHRFDFMVFSQIDRGVMEIAAALLTPGGVIGVFPVSADGNPAEILREQASLLVSPGPDGAVLAARATDDRRPKRRGGRRGRAASDT